MEKIDSSYKGAEVIIMMSDGKVIGGCSFPIADEQLNGAFYSLDGKTLEEVTGLSFKQWFEKWKEKYKTG